MNTASRKQTRKETLARLIALASEGNAHAVSALNQVLNLTDGRLERQHVLNAIQHAERAFRKATAAPAAEPAPAKSYLESNFGLDAETARRWEMVKAAR